MHAIRFFLKSLRRWDSGPVRFIEEAGDIVFDVEAHLRQILVAERIGAAG